MSSILETTESIQFALLHATPLRAKLNFSKLGTTSMLFFLAPRVLENDEEDNDLDDNF